MAHSRPVPATTGRRRRGSRAASGPGERRPLERARIGVVPILWNNADLPELAPPVAADAVLDEIAGLGYAGTQAGVGFPSGALLRRELEGRNLRLAEVYVAIPATADGPAGDAGRVARAALEALVAADGDVLVAALALSPGREERAGRVDPGAPPMTKAGWLALANLLDGLGRVVRQADRRLAFHPHAGTFVETPAEVERLLAGTDPELVGLCLDVGHYLVGGGDPVAAVERHGDRLAHVHLKDVAPEPLARLRDGSLGGFLDALRARIFTELGGGLLDVDGIVRALDGRRYAGWIMVEQDTTWRTASESASMSRRVLDAAIARLDQGRPQATTATGTGDRPGRGSQGRTSG